MSLESLPFNPILNMVNERMGCSAQCPFCGSCCNNGFDCIGTKQKHMVELHRPQVTKKTKPPTSIINFFSCFRVSPDVAMIKHINL